MPRAWRDGPQGPIAHGKDDFSRHHLRRVLATPFCPAPEPRVQSKDHSTGADQTPHTRSRQRPMSFYSPVPEKHSTAVNKISKDLSLSRPRLHFSFLIAVPFQRSSSRSSRLYLGCGRDRDNASPAGSFLLRCAPGGT